MAYQKLGKEAGSQAIWKQNQQVGNTFYNETKSRPTIMKHLDACENMMN